MHCCRKDAAVSLASKVSEWRGAGGRGREWGSLPFPFLPYHQPIPFPPRRAFWTKFLFLGAALSFFRENKVTCQDAEGLIVFSDISKKTQYPLFIVFVKN